jgi:hypothetical protein
LANVRRPVKYAAKRGLKQVQTTARPTESSACVPAQIAASCDIDAIKAWLARYVDSLATFASYRRGSRTPAMTIRHRTV